MNKSLVLVMCDVLVLSAMSLSTGSFDESLEHSASDCETTIECPNAVGSNYSRDQLEALTTLLMAASNECFRLDSKLKEKEGLLSLTLNKYTNATNRNVILRERIEDETRKSSAARKLLQSASNHIDALNRDLANISNSNMAVIGKLARVNDKLLEVSGKYDDATNDIKKLSHHVLCQEQSARRTEKKLAEATNTVLALRKQLDDEVGSGLLERRRRIHESKCCLDVGAVYGDERKSFCSPVVKIGTNCYAIAYMSRKDIPTLAQLKIWSQSGKILGGVKSIWALSGDYDENILLFQFDQIVRVPVLGIGSGVDSLNDHYYWSSSKDWDVDPAGRLIANARSALNAYMSVKPGDMLLSERSAAVVGIVTEEWLVQKKETRFGRIAEKDLVLVRDFENHKH